MTVEQRSPGEIVHPQGGDLTLNCFGCGREVVLPVTTPGYVSIVPIEGWTAPPLLCPECSNTGDRAGATGGHIGGPS